MYEVQAANFRKGVFEIHLHKHLRIPLLKQLIRLGPVRGRLVGLGGLVFAFMLSLNKAPSKFFLENKYAENLAEALAMQDRLMWFIVGASALFYIFVFLFRESKVELDFDRSKESLYLSYTPSFSFSKVVESVWPFREIQKIEVSAPDKAPKTPHGRIKIVGPVTARSGLKEVDFAFLSEEQREFFPLNISRLTELDPVGDWVDPDSVIPE